MRVGGVGGLGGGAPIGCGCGPLGVGAVDTNVALPFAVSFAMPLAFCLSCTFMGGGAGGLGVGAPTGCGIGSSGGGGARGSIGGFRSSAGLCA